MKTVFSNFAPLALAVGAAFLSACPSPSSSSDAGAPAPTADAAVRADASVPPIADAGAQDDAGPPVRTVTQNGTLFGTTAVNNLLVDPTFGTVFSGGLTFFSLEEVGGQLQQTYGIPFERGTPSRTPGLAVQGRSPGSKVKTAGMFGGGKGPFHLEAWLSLGDAVPENTFTAQQVRVRVGEVWIGAVAGSAVYELQRVPEDDVGLNGRVWWHMVANVTQDLPPTCIFVAESRVADAALLLAGPQVVPVEPVMNAAGVARIPVYPARVTAWTARDRPLMQEAVRHMPQLGTPAWLRQDAIRAELAAGKTRRNPVPQ